MIFCVLRWTWSFVFISVFVFVLVSIYMLCFGAATDFSVNKDLYTVPVLTGRPLVRVNETAVRSVSVWTDIVRDGQFAVPCTRRPTRCQGRNHFFKVGGPISWSGVLLPLARKKF